MTNQTPVALSRKTRLRRRSVAAVLWALGTLVTLQLAFHYPLSAWWPQLHDVEFGQKLFLLRAQLRDRSADQPLVLGLGSSLTGMGLRPDVMARTSAGGPEPLVFNYAIKGGPILIQMVCLKRLTAEGIHPDLVLVETYPPFYLSNPQTDPGKLLDHFPSHRFQRRDLALVTRYNPDPHGVRTEWRKGQCVPWYFHRNFLMNWYMPRWIANEKRINFHRWQTDAWGWDSCPIFYEQAKATYLTPGYLEDVRKQGETWDPMEINEDLHGVLCDLLNFCRREKIDVAMVWPPEASPIRASYSPALSARCTQWFARLHAETGAPLIKARDWLDDASFADGLHLTPDGARDYTQRLEREILQRLEVRRQAGKTITAHR